MTTPLDKIRNFCIIAHIDHGKSTLADRLMEHANLISDREKQDQLLDDMELERERGITIKSHPVHMFYRADDGEEYEMNLIDTPGHVDFSYEVSRSLSSCEGALLVVDAAQGIQAQTVANVMLAMKHDLAIIPVINKIDLPSANVEMVKEQLEEVLAIPADDAVAISAKANLNIDLLMEAICKRIPAPTPSHDDDKLRALIFDSQYDTYRGVINYIRITNGSVKVGDKVRLLSNGLTTEIKGAGFFTPKMSEGTELYTGTVGYIVPNIKSPHDTPMGDTITLVKDPCDEPLPGFEEMQPMVYSSIYPIDTNDYEQLKFAVAKLQLNDPAFVYQNENSAALGFGFRCGFLGLLHMEIIQERLRREFNMDIIATYPSVIYHVNLKSGKMIEVDNPVHLPDPTLIESTEEPVIEAKIMLPSEYIGGVMNLILEKRGLCTNTESADANHVILTATLPLHEVIVDFNDKLKSITRGYGSMNYEHAGYQKGPFVKMELLVNSEPVDAFSSIVHRDNAEYRGRILCEKLKKIIPQMQFKIPIQAAIGGKIIARETISALRKDVTAKCYGGDITRKRKLLEKQKEGKKKMKMFGKVSIPQEAFVKVLKNDV